MQIAVIKSNPEQSKHLQTARMKVGDLELDLVNLRSETYTNSRIPDSTPFGTPEQDALRRDFTINSMFYNINSGQAGVWPTAVSVQMSPVFGPITISGLTGNALQGPAPSWQPCLVSHEHRLHRKCIARACPQLAAMPCQP